MPIATRRPLLRSFSVLFLLFLSAGNSRADDAIGFVQLTCTPELGLFSAHRIQLPNIPELGPYLQDGRKPSAETLKLLQDKYGLYESFSLKQKPLKCLIPALPAARGFRDLVPGFEVRVVGHFDADSANGSYRDMADNAEVLLNGRRVALLTLNPFGFTVETSSIDISQQEHGLNLRTCSVSAETVDGGKLDCKTNFMQISPR